MKKLIIPFCCLLFALQFGCKKTSDVAATNNLVKNAFIRLAGNLIFHKSA